MKQTFRFVALLAVTYLFSSLGQLKASETAAEQLQAIASGKFVAVLIVDSNRNFTIQKVVKGELSQGARAAKAFKARRVSFPENSRFLYVESESNQINGATFTPSLFIQIFIGEHIFIENSPIHWPDLFRPR